MANSGFTFIEVLVATFLLSIGLLGLSIMHFTTMHDALAADFLSTANYQIVNISERLNSIDSDHDLSAIIQQWNYENSITLPAGTGTVTGKFPNYVATIFWGNKIKSCNKNHIGLSGCLRQKIQVVFH